MVLGKMRQMFRWLNDKEQNIYTVTFYFNSGQLMSITSTREKVDAVLKNLRGGWHGFTVAGDDLGINFAHVTHYKVRQGA